MRGLKDKVFIIAGGGSGIGAATAQRLAEEGAAVVVGDLHQENARQTVNDIVAAGGKALAFHFDMSVESSVRALVAAAVEQFGGLDGMHVNAADLEAIKSDTDAMSVPLDIFDRTVAVNLRGHLLCTRYALPELLKRGGGSLVYTSSAAAYFAGPTRVSYGMSKSGLHALVRHVAIRWGKEKVRSNAVSPGLVMTDTLRRGLPEQEQRAHVSRALSWRLGEGRDLAAAVAFLMSDDAEWITGQVLCVDGGLTVRA